MKDVNVFNSDCVNLEKEFRIIPDNVYTFSGNRNGATTNFYNNKITDIDIDEIQTTGFYQCAESCLVNGSCPNKCEYYEE